MGIDGLTFVPKSGNFFINLGQVCLKKVAFLNFFKENFELAFLTKCWLFRAKNLPCPCSWLLWLLYLIILPKYHSKGPPFYYKRLLKLS